MKGDLKVEGKRRVGNGYKGTANYEQICYKNIICTEPFLPDAFLPVLKWMG